MMLRSQTLIGERRYRVTSVRECVAETALDSRNVGGYLRRLPRPALHWKPENVRGMVIGVGTDLMENARIARSVERFGEAFLRRVYTPGEVAYCQRKKNSAESFAARFAAKEAGAKALGTGISRGVSWTEFEVRRERGQRPELFLSGRAAEIAKALGIRRLSLSLTHSREFAMAVVIAED
jgi:holo-[acyl-carrier protein] synthase